jgi:uncharacterized membrane protein YhaH (DUF805 family)
MTEPVATPRKYWFAAKRYGLGWLPSAWQGWLVLIVFIALLGVSVVVFPPATHPVASIVSNVVLVGLLIAVCCIKGEPLRWRWGRKRP